MKRSLRKFTQQGMTLIEVLASVLILSVGVLGLVGLQARASRTSLDAEFRNTAALLANQIISQMWAYPGQPTADLADLNPTMINDWIKVVNYTLPDGSGDVSKPDPTNANAVTVTVTWTSPTSRARADKSTSTYVTVVNM